MSEDNKNQNNDNAADAATLKTELDAAKKELAAANMKQRRSDEDLYSEDYLNYLKDKNKKQQPQNNFTGGKLSDYSDEELQNLPLSKLTVLIRNDVYGQMKGEESSRMTREQADARKKKVVATRKEIKEFAKGHPDFWNYVDRIDELADENPKLNTEQLYILAGGKLKEPPPKEEKKKDTPNTRPENEAGMKKSDKNLSLRDVIAEEYQKLK